MRNVFILSVLLAIAFVTTSAQRMTRQQYIDKYKGWAIEEMNRTGIPASITLAQGILESDCGNSDLAIDANNHFGIKCHSDWTGETFTKDDDKKDECFRSYDDAYKSFKDHSDFLVSKSRYAELFKLKRTDYEGWARGLKKCGYATEPTYAERLIKIIEEEKLHKYDTGEEAEPETIVADKGGEEKKPVEAKAEETEIDVPRKTPKVKADFAIEPLMAHEVKYNNGIRYIEVRGQDTFESIASEFHLMQWELLKYNDLDHNADIKTIKYLYLRPKKNRAHPDCPTYTIKTGDTLWNVAHRYGVKLRKLQKRNGFKEGQEPVPGDEIVLR
ncbi:MAG: glucosaminidase domain-containing protein [Bacteroidales bacterium]|nr:glucosaminidase domain-containing protein [Bacteroidales bacterium]